MNPSVRLQQLYIIRSQLDMLIAMEEGLVLPEGEFQCPHPEEKRRDTTVMGQPRTFMCLACGATVEGVV